MSKASIFEYSTKPGRQFLVLLLAVQFVCYAFVFFLPFTVLVQASYLTLSLLFFCLIVFRLKREVKLFPVIAFSGGLWGLRYSAKSEVELIQPLEHTSVFPMVLILAFQDSKKKRHYKLIWRDVVGDHHFRQLSRQLSEYFFLKQKSK